MARFAKYQINYDVLTSEDNTSAIATYSFFFLAPPDHYEGIETETGVTKLADDSTLADMPITKTSELSISPVATRKTLRVTNENTNRTKYVDILISASEAAEATNTLIGKRYKDGVIKRVLDSRKQTKY